MTLIDNKVLIYNRAKCLICGDILESFHVHDFKSCSCGNISVDGGLQYIKRSAKNVDKIQDLCVYKYL